MKIFDEEIIKDQLGGLPFDDLRELSKEYEVRESKESIIAKDADLIDQVLLLREYEWQGNREASIWLRGKGEEKGNKQVKKLNTDSAKQIAESIYDKDPSEWWNNNWTDKNR